MAQAELAFGRFRLQPGRQLFLGDDPIPLGAKPLNVLTALVTAQGDLVTKDELIERVWAGMVVEENAIQAHISAIRKLLGEDAGMIATVPGRGYRFTGPVELRSGEMPKPAPPPVSGKVSPPAAPVASQAFVPKPARPPKPAAIRKPATVKMPAAAKPKRARRSFMPMVLAAAVVVAAAVGLGVYFGFGPKSVAQDRYLVLPFANHTGDPHYDTLAETMAGDVGSRLKTQAWEAEIVDPAEVSSGKQRPVVSTQQAQKLRLAYIIDGSLLFGDGALQASATIIDAQTGTRITTVTTHAAAHEEADQRPLLVTGLVDRSRFVVAREQRRKAAAGAPDDTDIRNLLIRAQARLDASASADTWRNAVDLIDKALKLDPLNAHTLTTAGASRIQFVESYSYKDATQRTAILNEADVYLSQALSIESDRAVIHLVMGDLRSAQGRHDAARAEYKRVLDLDSLNAEAMDGLAMEDIVQGFPGAAIPKLELALATDPEDAHLIYSGKAILEMSLGRDAEALAAARQAATVDSTDPRSWFTLAGLLQLAGQTDEARSALDSLRRIDPELTIAKLRMGDVNISPALERGRERLYAALKDAGMAEGSPADAVASQPK